MQDVPNFKIIDSNNQATRPFGGVGIAISTFPNQQTYQGSDLLITPFASLTAAHVISDNDLFLGEVLPIFSRSYPAAIPNGTNFYDFPYGEIAINDFKISDEFLNDLDNKISEDYGVMRNVVPFIYPFYTGLVIDNSMPRFINVVGYPGNTIGMRQGFAQSEFDDSFCGGFFPINPPLTYDIATVEGTSGGPIFNQAETFSTGITTAICPDDDFGAGVSFNNRNAMEIQSWLWNPTGVMSILSPEPNFTVNLVHIPPFNGTFSTFNRMDIHGDIEVRGDNFDHLIKWESHLNGFIGQGGIISADILKATLTSGTHRMTAKIDSSGESGEKNFNIRIIRPVGQFTSPNRCIKNIANPSSCTFDLSWNVTDTPETSVVLNETTNSDFASGNSGTQSFTTNTNSNTRFKLYPSSMKKILLDTLDTNSLSVKTPTGTLSRTVAVCSLQPSPIDPITLQLRAPKATPSGCDTKLTWSNIKWAAPSIYYKLTGSNTWQHLYTVSCPLDGSVCSGEINTDQILSELIPVAGVQFKLIQFNNTNAGELSAPFTVTAHRFADVYEYDNGDVTDFDGSGVGIPSTMVIDNTLTTAANIGVAQHNHSFHSPAVYDSREDIDTVQVQVAQSASGAGFAEGTHLTATVFNMSNGLNVDMQLKCAGIIVGGIFDGQTGIFDFDSNPTEPIVIDPDTGAKTMGFSITGQTNQIGSQINCLYNRVVIRRTAGTASETLRYSVIVNDPNISDIIFENGFE